MYNLKVADFVDIKENLSSFDVEDMVHICKRKNNAKRQYLFVNKYQGKHIPIDPTKISHLFVELFEQIGIEFAKDKPKDEKVVIVGFAETATAIGETMATLMYYATELPVEFVAYMQTSREEYDCKKLFDFSEEHSHAVNQYLYCKEEMPEFDRVIFIEDEITTGKTILNFISEFSKINPKCKYSVASILNWQNKESVKTYKDMDIDRIYLVSGELKDNVPSIDIEENEVEDYFTNQNSDEVKISSVYESDIHNARLGLLNEDFEKQLDIMTDINMCIAEMIDKEDSIMVVGTEEFMFYPMSMGLFSKISENLDLCKSVKFRATTRSPITPCNSEGYIVSDGITLPSAYEPSRRTYLYNLKGDYNKMIVVTEKGVKNEFVNALKLYCENNDKEFEIICL